jgi:predicted ATPase
MATEHWERVQLLFEAALAQPDDARIAFIEEACRDETDLRDELFSMLHTRSGEDKTMPPTWLGVLAGPDPLLFAAGDLVAGRYQIRQLLGRGGMGEVYEAWDDELSIPVALKTLNLTAGKDQAQRLKLEGLLARSISHPNVCRVYDLGRHGQGSATVWFLTMEVLRGQTLAERLRETDRLPLDRALHLATQMAAGLGAAHRAGVVHRDFKSSNVMLVGEGDDEQAVVTDFGIARGASLTAPNHVLSAEYADHDDRSHAVMGTPGYMAPEQWQGGEVGPAADIYALGMVLYEMSTGRLPFPTSGIATAKRRTSDPVPSPRSICQDIDERWEAVILRCLEVEPSRRFARAEDVTRALTGQLAVDGIETPGPITPAQHNLPSERDAFVGREGEIEELARNLDCHARMVTLLGAGGMGKTRLAVRYGWQHLAQWPGGVWFCDLTEARSVDAIASALAGAFDVQLGKGDPLEQLGNVIVGRGRCLIVLDNFEQIASHAAATVGRWMEKAGEARFLVTSRERLGLGDMEIVQVVDSMSAEAGLVLLTLRAQWLRPGLDLRGSETESAREIVELVDGMPLAIELAAARMRVMSATQIVQQMRSRFQLLTGGQNARHETLAVAIDGSWELLRPWEQAACAQCAVFQGGFTLEAAENVLDLSAWPEAPWVVDVVQALVDKSLLRMWVPVPIGSGVGEAMGRIGMYASLQEYAGKKLRTLDPAAARRAEERHGKWYAQFGTDEALDALDGRGGLGRTRGLLADIDNMQVACRRAIRRGDVEVAVATLRASNRIYLNRRVEHDVEIALAEDVAAMPLAKRELMFVLLCLGWALRKAGNLTRVYDAFERALALSREIGSRKYEGIILGSLGGILRQQGRMEEARTAYETATAIHREVGDRPSEQNGMDGLGVLHLLQGRMAEAQQCFDSALAIARELGNRAKEGYLLGQLAILAAEQGRIKQARELYEATLAISREAGDLASESNGLGNLASLLSDLGLLTEARVHYERALAIAREIGDRALEGVVLGNLGTIEMEEGQFDRAQEHITRALAIAREMSNRRSEGYAHGHLGFLNRERGRIEEARRHLEASIAIAQELGNPRLEGLALGGLGAVLGDEGRFEEGRVALVRGEGALVQVGGQAELGLLRCNLAELEARAGEHLAAAAARQAAEAVANEIGATPGSLLRRRLAELEARARKERSAPEPTSSRRSRSRDS